MTPRRWAFTYLATAASMAALGAATAVAVVALEERASRRLGDGEAETPGEQLMRIQHPETWPDDTHDRRAPVSNDSTYTGPERRDPLAASVGGHATSRGNVSKAWHHARGGEPCNDVNPVRTVSPGHYHCGGHHIQIEWSPVIGGPPTVGTGTEFYSGPERRDPLAASVHCDHDCTCHGRRAGE